MNKVHNAPVEGILCASCTVLMSCVAVLAAFITCAAVEMNRHWTWNHSDRS